MAGFLTDEWLSDLERAAHEVAVPTGVDLVVQQVVADGPREVVYAMELAAGSLTVRGGRAEAPDVTFHLDAATARAIHDGHLSAQVAFLDGRLRLSGHTGMLLVAAPVLAQLHDVFARARA